MFRGLSRLSSERKRDFFCDLGVDGWFSGLLSGYLKQTFVSVWKRKVYSVKLVAVCEFLVGEAC